VGIMGKMPVPRQATRECSHFSLCDSAPRLAGLPFSSVFPSPPKAGYPPKTEGLPRARRHQDCRRDASVT